MPRVETKNEVARALTGFHLYHAGWSNCSMRVRMVLEEKGQEWISHHFDTRKGEHISPEYFGIHPKGLVPALVHDGEVWIESNDIIDYLDDLLSPIQRDMAEIKNQDVNIICEKIAGGLFGF